MIIHRKKKYQIIGTPKSIGQAKIVGDLIENISIKPCAKGKMSPLCLEEGLLVLFYIPSSKC
jgi:hypothetical protein